MSDVAILMDQLRTVHPLTDKAINAVTELLEETKLLKGDFLVREGERAHYSYALISGVIRVFYANDGNDYNKTFFTEGTFPTPLTALLTGEPSRLNYQALTDCRIIRFHYQKFRDLFAEHRCLETMFLKILEGEWIRKEIHDIRMVTNDATANYLIFREEHPGLEQLIPQYHIASYLGITPIQLSRIRAQLLQAG